jgi:hypothetical protein
MKKGDPRRGSTNKNITNTKSPLLRFPNLSYVIASRLAIRYGVDIHTFNSVIDNPMEN